MLCHPACCASSRTWPATGCVCRKPRPFDLVNESRTVGDEGRAALLPFEAVCFAVQVDQRDRNPDNYTLPVTLADLSAVLIEGQSSASINQLSRLLNSLSPSLGQLLQISVCVTRPLSRGIADVVNQLLRSLISIRDYITPICFRNTLRECTLVHAHSD